MSLCRQASSETRLPHAPRTPPACKRGARASPGTVQTLTFSPRHGCLGLTLLPSSPPQPNRLARLRRRHRRRRRRHRRPRTTSFCTCSTSPRRRRHGGPPPAAGTAAAAEVVASRRPRETPRGRQRAGQREAAECPERWLAILALGMMIITGGLPRTLEASYRQSSHHTCADTPDADRPHQLHGSRGRGPGARPRAK